MGTGRGWTSRRDTTHRRSVRYRFAGACRHRRRRRVDRVTVRVGRRERPIASADSRRVRAHAAVQGAADRDRDPPRAQDGGAAHDAAAEAGPTSSRPATSTRPSRRPSTTSGQRHRRHRRPDRRSGRARPVPARASWRRSPTSSSTTAATCSAATSRTRTTACAAAPRRRPPAATGCCRCANGSAMPILVINDSPIKQFGENTHAVGAGRSSRSSGSPTGSRTAGG